MPPSQTITLTIHVVRVGSAHLAVTELGGLRIRSNRREAASEAVLDLFNQMGQPHHDNAVMGVELALEGSTLDELVAGVEEGDEPSR